MGHNPTREAFNKESSEDSISSLKLNLRERKDSYHYDGVISLNLNFVLGLLSRGEETVHHTRID